MSGKKGVNKKTPANAGVFKNQKPKFMKPFTCMVATFGNPTTALLMIRTAAKIDIFLKMQAFFEKNWHFFEKILDKSEFLA